MAGDLTELSSPDFSTNGDGESSMVGGYVKGRDGYEETLVYIVYLYSRLVIVSALLDSSLLSSTTVLPLPTIIIVNVSLVTVILSFLTCIECGD